MPLTRFDDRGRRRPRHHYTALTAAGAVILLMATGCSSPGKSDPQALTPEPILVSELLDSPSALAMRPGTLELWIANSGDDSLTIIDLDDPDSAQRLQDGYGEHFTARPSGIAFNEDGTFFAISNDSNNEVRDMEFVLNPERESHFRNNNFMGPTLFSPETFALAGQNKAYLDDWPQPGISHDPPDDIPEHQCPAEYWAQGISQCAWPRQGSHLDMLHGNPLSTGIVHDAVNAYYVLDGCGVGDSRGSCDGPGHVARIDFNRDHQEGNGFHGDGVTQRYIDLPYKRVDGVPSGMMRHDGWVYYSDTGAGTVRRFQPDTGRFEVMVSNWNDSPASHGEHGPGVVDWSHLEDGPGDGDDPETVSAWVAEHGNQEAIDAAGDSWIMPRKTLAEYSYVWEATAEKVAPGSVDRPSGLVAGESSWFVADNDSGRILEFDWDGSPGRVIETGLDGLTGLALSEDGSELFFTDTDSNGVDRVRLG
ncbi:hypothetical protein G6016_00420 [Dietzia aerolata]|uniref:Glucose/Sorbosone dehydrogenase domain-containing protein n=1 Tax=Dietzia aerolata TaxID=595984 RepID=A0ABV5JNI1_9ACTN|nr:hypothetical protein [Dietzia aerolata]MBB0967448.1 hypothetical protein [Dietzia aerolata]